MNKTTIEWCDYTWNPVTGCKHNCPYCYARKIAGRFAGRPAWRNGFEPTLHPERFNDPSTRKKHQTIFVCSVADLFGDWVSESWINDVMVSANAAPQHTYCFLTKNPARYLTLPWKYLSKDNFWFGTSITGDGDEHRLHILRRLISAGSKNLFISFEPLLMDVGTLNLNGIKQVIIGAQTNPDNYVGLEWVMKICESADRAGSKVFMKDSLNGRWPDREMRRELCWKTRGYP